MRSSNTEKTLNCYSNIINITNHPTPHKSHNSQTQTYSETPSNYKEPYPRIKNTKHEVTKRLIS